MATVQITGWNRGFLAISFVKLLRQYTGEGLAPAKEKLERLLEGEQISLDLPDVATAASFVRELDQIGGSASIVDQGQGKLRS